MKACTYLALVCLLMPLPVLAADYSGTVLGPNNQPMKGATVYFVDLERHGEAGGTRQQLPSTQTDEAGAFHFSQRASGNVEFLAVADGYGLSTEDYLAGMPLQIIMRPRTDVTVTLRTADGKPAANVRISLRAVNLPMRLIDGYPQKINLPWFYRTPWSVMTDASGACELPGMPRGGSARFDLDDSRYAAFAGDELFALGNTAQTRIGPITLEMAGSISGKITFGATTQPASGVRVRAWVNANTTGQSVTARDGSFTINRLAPGNYTIWPVLSQDMMKSWTAASIAKATITAGQHLTGVDFGLIRGVLLRATVLAADNSAPVAGVRLAVQNSANPQAIAPAEMVVTDTRGEFLVRVPPGEQHVYIVDATPARGFGRPVNDAKELTIRAGGAGFVEFRLPRAFLSPIVGTVVGPAGKPIAGASVFAYSEDPPLLYNSRNAILTSATGTFQTLPIQRGTRVALRARFQDLGTPRAVDVSRDTVGDVVIQLQKNALGSLKGEVVDPDGRPLKNARLSLIYPIGRYRFNIDAGMTDSQGRYTVASLWPDMTYTLQVRREAYGVARSKITLRVTSGGTTVVPNLVLYRRDSVVAGVLMDHDNKPVAGQRISVRGPRSGYDSTSTDAHGKFRVAVVAGDTLSIYYNFAPNRPASERAASAGDSNIVLHTFVPVSAVSYSPMAAANDSDDAATWTGWLWAVILLLIGGIATIIVNSVAAVRDRKSRGTTPS